MLRRLLEIDDGRRGRILGLATQKGFEPEISEGVFKVGVESLNRSHALVRHIFQGEDDPLFTFAQRCHAVPELIAVKDDHGSRFSRELQL